MLLPELGVVTASVHSHESHTENIVARLFVSRSGAVTQLKNSSCQQWGELVAFRKPTPQADPRSSRKQHCGSQESSAISAKRTTRTSRAGVAHGHPGFSRLSNIMLQFTAAHVIRGGGSLEERGGGWEPCEDGDCNVPRRREAVDQGETIFLSSLLWTMCISASHLGTRLFRRVVVHEQRSWARARARPGTKCHLSFRSLFCQASLSRNPLN
jgi:hypothetical protein